MGTTWPLPLLPTGEPLRGVILLYYYKIVPGWNEYVEPYRKKSILWHKIWIENAKSKHGIVVDIVRKTRSDYHHHMQWAKQNSRFIESQKMADSVKKGQMKKFWSEVKRIRGCKTTVTASLDGETDDDRIANVFACKYNALYNCVSYDSNDLNGIKREMPPPFLSLQTLLVLQQMKLELL